MLEQILNTPPPPPPPDVPNLPLDKELTGSLRKVMEQHRANPVCASCHQRMDPIGFAFENFDAIGAWRDKDGRFAIDPSGVLPDGKAFQGPAELKAHPQGQKRSVQPLPDRKDVNLRPGPRPGALRPLRRGRILEALDKNDYRFSVLLLAVVKSDPFQMRTAPGENHDLHGGRISRRTVLRGIGGAVVALPFLEAMLPRADAAEAGQCRAAAAHGVPLRPQRRQHGRLDADSRRRRLRAAPHAAAAGPATGRTCWC